MTDADPDTARTSGDLVSELIDLSALDLATITALPDSALAASLRRILYANDNPAEQYARFQSMLEVE